MPDDVQTLLDLENRRCEAIAAGDGTALTAMLDKDYVHIHLNGFEDTREGHVQRVLDNPRQTERDDIRVRIFGDLALLNGGATNNMKNPADGSNVVLKAAVQQVLVRRDAGWVYVLTQMTPATPPSPELLASLRQR